MQQLHTTTNINNENDMTTQDTIFALKVDFTFDKQKYATLEKFSDYTTTAEEHKKEIVKALEHAESFHIYNAGDSALDCRAQMMCETIQNRIVEAINHKKVVLDLEEFVAAAEDDRDAAEDAYKKYFNAHLTKVIVTFDEEKYELLTNVKMQR